MTATECREIGHRWDRPRDVENSKPGTYTCEVCDSALTIEEGGARRYRYSPDYSTAAAAAARVDFQQ